MLFLTPVIYPPPKGDNIFALIVAANPVTPFIVTIRELATDTVVTSGTAFFWLSATAVFGFLLAWVLYKVSLPYVIERLSS
jgi:lipopolysaccharide transport system permease protein